MFTGDLCMDDKNINDSLFQGQQILEHAPDGIFMIDSGLKIRYVNPAFCRLLGYDANEVLGTSITDHLGDLSILASCMESVSETGSCVDQETIFRRKDGSMVHISKNVQAIQNEDGSLSRIIIFIRDMTRLHLLNQQLSESQQKLQSYINNLETVVDERTKELSEQLYTDSLTKLPNRMKLLVDLTKGLDGKVLILLNIDGFKEINSYFGQDAGDTILTQVANELITQISGLKMGKVYKLPSDEYAIVIQEHLTHEQTESIVVKMGEKIKHRSLFARSDEDISLDVTIGVAMLSEADDSSRDLLSFADMAQKLAKKERKPYLFYTPSMQIKEEYEQNLGWIKRLKSAIEEDRVLPFFQPIIEAKTLQIKKYEALVRIQEGDVFVSPVEFLRIAKKVKLYHHITKIMVDKTLAVFAPLQSSVSINISIEDILNESVNSYLLNKVRECGFAERIIFEITESEGISNYNVVNEFIKGVKRHGSRIALDDFGSGYSNFFYVTQLNIDFIKIDGSIIRQIAHNQSAQIITETIISFASKLGIKTIAEFVSDEAIYRCLERLSIDSYQGYYFGAPAQHIRELKF